MPLLDLDPYTFRDEWSFSATDLEGAVVFATELILLLCGVNSRRAAVSRLNLALHIVQVYVNI